MSEIDVTVIIPAFNRLWCLPRAIESCRNTKCKTEIIVVDDGSTDGTWEWLQTQSDITAIRQENQGQTYAINRGFSMAHGKYIRFLDSDDFLTEQAIDTQFQKAIDTGAQLVCSRVDFYNEASGIITVCPDITGWADFMEVQLSNRYGSHFLGMLFHRSLIEQTPRRPDFALREDRMFLLEIGLLEPRIAIAEGCSGYWVQHAQQMQGNYGGLHAQAANWQHLQIYRRILKQMQDAERRLPRYKKAACTSLWPLAFWISKSHISAAMAVVEWIFELDPEFEIPDKGVLGFMFRNLGVGNTYKLLHLRRSFKRNT